MSQKSMKKTRSFLLKKSLSSMQIPNSPNHSATTFVSNKHLSIEFPTSPQLPGEEEEDEILHHPSHQHPSLLLLTLPNLFTCAGCKEFGAGKRFTCQLCEFQLHHFCALSPPLLQTHPLHGQHQLVFHSKSKPGGIFWPKCDVCGKATRGFTFRCSACSFQMHPCCAMLSTVINYPGHAHTLKLFPELSLSRSSSDDPGFACGECKRKRSGLVYRCTLCDYHLHAVCAKSMINGLQAYGIKVPDKPSMLGTAARLASNVVVGFIGGLIEGLGEGVGEVIVQTIAKGRSNSNGRRGIASTIEQNNRPEPS